MIIHQIISNVAVYIGIMLLTDFPSQEVFYQEIDRFCRGKEEQSTRRNEQFLLSSQVYRVKHSRQVVIISPMSSRRLP